jgi:hypothetical protein
MDMLIRGLALSAGTMLYCNPEEVLRHTQAALRYLTIRKGAKTPKLTKSNIETELQRLDSKLCVEFMDEFGDTIEKPKSKEEVVMIVCMKNEPPRQWVH